MISKNTGIKRVIYAAGYSYKGLKHNFLYEAAFRQEVIAALILIPVALYLDVTKVEKLMLISSVVLVMIVELLNTAIEAVVDRISLDFHELSGLAKDTGSSAVLFSLILCIYFWVEIVIL